MSATEECIKVFCCASAPSDTAIANAITWQRRKSKIYFMNCPFYAKPIFQSEFNFGTGSLKDFQNKDDVMQKTRSNSMSN